MTGEVTNDDTTTRRVDQTRQQDEARVRRDNDEVRRAADDVDARRVSERLGDRDNFDKAKADGTSTTTGATPTGSTPHVQLASLGVPVGLFNSGSPIDSAAAVR